MPNTTRTLSQLLGLFPDNVVRNIHPQNDRDFIVSAFPFLRSVDPTPDNDRIDSAGIGAFFDFGSHWLNLVTGHVWYCLDGHPTAALWFDEATTPLPPGPLPENVTQYWYDSTNITRAGLNFPPGSGIFYIDGQTLTVIDHVSDHEDLGPWIVRPGAWERPSWFSGTLPNARIVACQLEAGGRPQGNYVFFLVSNVGAVNFPIIVDASFLRCELMGEKTFTQLPTEFSVTNVDFLFYVENVWDWIDQPAGSVLCGPDSGPDDRPTFKVHVPIGSIGLIPVTPAPSTSPGSIYYDFTFNSFIFYGSAGPIIPGASGGVALTPDQVVITDAGGLLTTIGSMTDGQLVIGVSGGPSVVGGLTSTDLSVTITPGPGTVDLSVPPSPPPSGVGKWTKYTVTYLQWPTATTVLTLAVLPAKTVYMASVYKRTAAWASTFSGQGNIQLGWSNGPSGSTGTFAPPSANLWSGGGPGPTDDGTLELGGLNEKCVKTSGSYNLDLTMVGTFTAPTQGAVDIWVMTSLLP